MKLYSTNNKNLEVSLKTAVFQGLPKDNGLFMPKHIPTLRQDFIDKLTDYTFQEIALEVAKSLLAESVPVEQIEEIIKKSITFPAPVVQISDRLFIQELFHGPSLAFKDFGARFMAQLMSFFNKDEEDDLIILVATSGDTGGAVAAGFYDTPGIQVVILYPSGKVSHLQEKQLTTLGKNITALEIDGSFDDCQTLVKKAFLDDELRKKLRISSANSINIARLIPQSFYYFEGFKQVRSLNDAPISFSIPSGNFGNLTAGVMAKKMGLPVNKFIAATNSNDVVPTYLKTGVYKPTKSVRTISNAMDVGNPSNFKRLEDIYCSTWNNFSKEMIGYSFTDHETKQAIRTLQESHQYIIDPHGAVGLLAAINYQKDKPSENIIVLETAHYAKFKPVMEAIISKEKIVVPKQLNKLIDKKKVAIRKSVNYPDFKEFLLFNYH